jgi:hypothetical protein
LTGQGTPVLHGRDSTAPSAAAQPVPVPAFAVLTEYDRVCVPVGPQDAVHALKDAAQLPTQFTGHTTPDAHGLGCAWPSSASQSEPDPTLGDVIE